MTYFTTPEARRAVKASSLAAALEMVRQGVISLRQDRAFAPLWIKKRDEAASATPSLAHKGVELGRSRASVCGGDGH